MEERLIAAQQLSRVWEVVDGLSPRQREVFLLRFVEELPLEEIAQVTGTQVGTVKAHLFRAVSTVRQRVRDHAVRTTDERH